MNKSKITGSVIENWKRLAIARQTIAFASGVEHSIALRDRWREEGFRAEHIDGTTPPDQRAEILADFAKRKIQIISNFGILTEGFDCPAVSAICLVRPTQSRGLWRQKVGRGLRPWEGKTDCLILDHANATALHGWITDPDDYSLKSGVSKGQGPRFRCPKCRAEFVGWPKYCPSCMYELPRGQQADFAVIEQDTTELVEAKPSHPIHMQRFYNMLLCQAKERGYKPGYADFRYKKRFGHWPPKHIANAAPLRTAFKYDPELQRTVKVWA